MPLTVGVVKTPAIHHPYHRVATKRGFFAGACHSDTRMIRNIYKPCTANVCGKPEMTDHMSIRLAPQPTIIPAATVLFVCSSMRMKLPVARLRR
jgi:hypothetical protein